MSYAPEQRDSGFTVKESGDVLGGNHGSGFPEEVDCFLNPKPNEKRSGLGFRVSGALFQIKESTNTKKNQGDLPIFGNGLSVPQSRFEFDDSDSTMNQRDDSLCNSSNSRSNPTAFNESLTRHNQIDSKLNDPSSHLNPRNSRFNQDRISTDSTLITDFDVNCLTNYSMLRA